MTTLPYTSPSLTCLTSLSLTRLYSTQARRRYPRSLHQTMHMAVITTFCHKDLAIRTKTQMLQCYIQYNYAIFTDHDKISSTFTIHLIRSPYRLQKTTDHQPNLAILRAPNENTIIINPDFGIWERRQLVDPADFVEDTGDQASAGATRGVTTDVLDKITRYHGQEPKTSILFIPQLDRLAVAYQLFLLIERQEKKDVQVGNTGTLINDLFIPPPFRHITLPRFRPPHIDPRPCAGTRFTASASAYRADGKRMLRHRHPPRKRRMERIRRRRSQPAKLGRTRPQKRRPFAHRRRRRCEQTRIGG